MLEQPFVLTRGIEDYYCLAVLYMRELGKQASAFNEPVVLVFEATNPHLFPSTISF
ncbi:MAG: hypothetical protein ACXAC7_09240 [Candidatus Hodarchaeales archaeon]